MSVTVSENISHDICFIGKLDGIENKFLNKK